MYIICFQMIVSHFPARFKGSGRFREANEKLIVDIIYTLEYSNT